eukprot:4596708-Lingulodinium_polyedra.AAC.1
MGTSSTCSGRPPTPSSFLGSVCGREQEDAVGGARESTTTPSLAWATWASTPRERAGPSLPS